MEGHTALNGNIKGLIIYKKKLVWGIRNWDYVELLDYYYYHIRPNKQKILPTFFSR